MKIVFMGTPDFSVPVLEKLIKCGHDVVAVFTKVDKPRGRGNEVSFSPVKEAAIKHNIKVYQPDRIRKEEYVSILRDINPDIMVVVAFGQILSQEILDIPKYGCINVHASLLPKLRGAAPIQWAVINGDEYSGVTTMYMDAGIDTGDIIEQKVVGIDSDETGGSLFDKLSIAGSELILSTIDLLTNGTAKRKKQDESLATYTKMLDKKLGDIDFGKSAIDIERLIRGLNPWPSAYTRYNGKMLKIWKAEVIEEDYYDDNNNKLLPGTIACWTDDSIIIQTGDKALAIYELQLEGKKRVYTEDFLRGYKVKLHERLGIH